MPAYWLISVPFEKQKDATWHKLRRAVAEEPNDYAELCSLAMPAFKTGTLDELIVLSNDLAKHDQVIEATVNKLAETMRNLLQEDQEHLSMHLTVNERSVDHYIKAFKWNSGKYRTDRPLREIMTTLVEEVSQIDTTLKTKMLQYTNVKNSVQSLERKQTGNLAVRSLAGVVKKDDCVLGSEYMQSIFVAVPRLLYKDWKQKYETLTEMVVPRSSSLIAEDNEFGLFSVVVFKRVAEKFMQRCREERFIVREFTFDETQEQRDLQELSELQATLQSLHEGNLEWCSTSFGLVFAAWMHIKVLRVFVESVLRYGLPPEYVTGTIKPYDKHIEKAYEVLNQLYQHLGRNFRQGNQQSEPEDTQYLGLYDKDYRPYVCFAIEWNHA